MKKLLCLMLVTAFSYSGFAKKVKFAVDMDTITPNVMGIHIGGDFQTLAGFAGGDWMSNTTPLTQEGSSHVYSIIVDIPAFSHYEYKFINGDQWYDAEFVPIESRVDPMSNDNRWIYVDSLGNDTTFVGAIIFAANAPRGLTLMRFYVDMTYAPGLDPTGVHVAGSFQNWDPTLTRLYSFGNNIYQIIAYDTLTTNEYKYYYGNNTGTSETVPAACAVNGNRQLMMLKDTVLDTVCFAGCSACVWNSISQVTSLSKVSLFPNPAVDQTTLTFGDDASYDVALCDLTGKTLKTWVSVQNELVIDTKELKEGMYFLRATNKTWAKTSALKFIVE